MSKKGISVIIRTLNESKYLPSLLDNIIRQKIDLPVEIVLVDSGSTDGTISIAKHYGCKILFIQKDQFSFGRSLNLGCEASSGIFLVFISGHCVPYNYEWLNRLIYPLKKDLVKFTYGKQIGGSKSFLSEKRIFNKYFSSKDKIPQSGFYCNNANSATTAEIWKKYKFNEELTGLEDIEFSKRLVNDGGLVGYVSSSIVYHYHHENNGQIKKRFEREAYALQKICPEIKFKKIDFFRYLVKSILSDLKFCFLEKESTVFNIFSIFSYRFFQYFGSYVGNNIKDAEIEKIKESYFYPTSNNGQIMEIKSKQKEEEKLFQSPIRKKIVALLPMKENSQRIINKNFKEFNGKPLFKWVLDTLLSLKKIDLIVINTDAGKILSKYGVENSKRILIRDRKKELCGDFVSMNRILYDDMKNIDSELYLMTHVTNPLLSKKTIENAISIYLNNKVDGKYDSLFSVNKLNMRLYTEDIKPFNHNPNILKRTQDLENLYEENSNLYIFSKESFLKSNSRIGKKPYMFITPKIESIDIDNYEEWEIAELISKNQFKS